jgi:hypothetical protein
MTNLDQTDGERLELLDRVEKRLPEIDLGQRTVEWVSMPDGAPGLAVDGGGFDGGSVVVFANAGDDLHAIGSVAPIVPNAIGCVVIREDRSRYLAKVMPDPLAERQPE